MTPADPADAAAASRVEAALDRLSRVNLQVVVVAMPDPVRLAAQDRGRRAAADAGRSTLLADACRAARDLADRAFARGGFSGTWAIAETGMSVTRAADRVAAAAAFEEVAIAAIAEDILDPDTLEILRSTAGSMAGLTGIPTPGALSSLASPHQGTAQGPWPTVAIAAFVVCLIVATFALGVGVASIAIMLSVALVAGLLRRRPGSQPTNEPLD